MKVRKGFVSNSSSSSYVVVMNDDFSPTDEEIEKIANDFFLAREKNISEYVDGAKKGIEQLKELGYVDEDGGWSYSIIAELCGDFIIAKMDTGSGYGQIINITDLDDLARIRDLAGNAAKIACLAALELEEEK